MITIRRAHWIMTGHTGHHLPGSLVNHLVSHGMAELPLGQMTARAYLVAVIPQHGQPVGAMDLVAFTARADRRVPMLALRIPGESILMARLAHLVARGLQHFFVVPGMGAVTQDTTVFRAGEHMIMRGHHGGLHARVAPQTGFAPGVLLSPMTGIAFFFGKRLMQMLPDKPLARAAMGVMTGQAAAELAWKAAMPGTALRLLMTGQAQGIGIHLEKLVVFCLMGLVANSTLPLGKGFVADSLRFCHLLMANKACFRQIFPEQAIMPSGMGRMAAKTFSISHRLVHHPFGKFGFGPLMAGVAERRPLSLQQSRIFGHMRIMAISALALGHRTMGEFAGEVFLVMALVANLTGQCNRAGKPGEQAEYQQNNKQAPHQLFLPG